MFLKVNIVKCSMQMLIDQLSFLVWCSKKNAKNWTLFVKLLLFFKGLAYRQGCSAFYSTTFFLHTTIFTFFLNVLLLLLSSLKTSLPIQSSSFNLPHFRGWSALYEPVCQTDDSSYSSMPLDWDKPLNCFVELFLFSDVKEY